MLSSTSTFRQLNNKKTVNNASLGDYFRERMKARDNELKKQVYKLIHEQQRQKTI
jgi:hypothetical protein